MIDNKPQNVVKINDALKLTRLVVKGGKKFFLFSFFWGGNGKIHQIKLFPKQLSSYLIFD